ncbi:hypothetical protein [Acinetobacter pittii]|uniref:hypothetical protein n=1 Tax=Acinetobacter pittii TaxID=48296 RepID=UPI000D356B44|nr:hypothetical protein [Acinetobacter pittii]PTV50373.1 hypothetical protein DBL01_01820 [Acinetobacter pittii]
MIWIVNLNSIFLNYKVIFLKKCNSSIEIKFKLFLIVFFLAPLVMELPQKISILFSYNIEESYRESETHKVEVLGYFKTGTSKQGGDIWAFAEDREDKRINYVLICNLISMVKCNLGDLKGEQAIVKLKQENSYPLKNMSVVYKFESENLNIGEGELIGLYKENKKFIFYFLFFIYIPSICFCLVFLRFFK